MLKMIKSILIANRGEIAIRIAKTATKMGVLVYCIQTNREANALYLDFADEIITLEENPNGSIFLNAEELIRLAKEHQIEAIHPGYGFLSESPYLASRCKDEGILFIGPSEKAIYTMGNKGMARNIAQKSGIPVLAGSTTNITNFYDAKAWVEQIGYPVIMKAVAGGGGKGMRIVRSADELELMYKLVTNEAKSAFNDDSLLIEKYIESPKHIEIQVLADQHGNAIHLFERECSIQRKHQKLMEEAPSVAVSDDLRNKMGEMALYLCRKINYHTLGTVEFLLDKDNRFYFLEMNTRVQVEHPITEAITGIDLIEQQIKTAVGEKLELQQGDIQRKGWAIELRINAEDVQADFSPNPGIIDRMEFPECSFLRVDTGFENGKLIPPSYDSMITKLIITGDNRQEAIKHALAVIENTVIKGVKTTIPFFKLVLNHPDFINGSYNTSFISEKLDKPFFQEQDEEKAAAIMALQAYLNEKQKIESNLTHKEDSAWATKMRNKLF
ncbi:ATP-grasp domain-containing protein [Labilibaculum sp. A4]|uniref:ATP-grasp domain-containing protein n=2 Tax=Labilibaculum euxinus TaxID=2686357 RepID=A0A425Y8Z9_9BACT|nr:ATP-grasp domain-containing protein [Marinifilaceae bacterium]MUP37547.1 ATP-grasp domain-containing protein [Labilibaculum euxinus]MVB06752.1 ATP-grasp domain-containing protein [Labilibaculum euxinus]MWN77586.1 ATP-grasp domain-containing protein [Labilibaculum euxinus]